MSTLKVNTIQNTSGTEMYLAKAWVNFNGTFGTSPFTVANGGIRAAGNVTSVTDNGIGDYTINFAPGTFSDTNYAVHTTVASTETGPGPILRQATEFITARSAASMQVITGYTYSGGYAKEDQTVVSVSVFR